MLIQRQTVININNLSSYHVTMHVWPNMPICENVWWDVTKCGKMWPNLRPACDKMWLKLRHACDKMWQNVTKYDKIWGVH